MLLAAVTADANRNAAAQDTSPLSVSGHVRNAVSGVPIPRVLVQIGSAAVFTDHDGKFVLENVSSGGTVVLTKPGYFTSPERTESPGVRITGAQLAQPLELRLYPEALLFGVVASQNGAPIRAVQVAAHRLVLQEEGRRFEMVASTQTDSHGAFRLAVPAGDYQVSTQFVATSSETGLAILPASVPSGSDGGTFHLSSGEQQRIELRVHTGAPHNVGILIRGLVEDRSPTVSVSTLNGLTWRVGLDDSGPHQATIHLPSGSYRLTVSSSDGETLSSGDVSVTVPDHDITGTVVQLAPVSPISIEVSVDPRNSLASPPSPQDLGVQLTPEHERPFGRDAVARLDTRHGQSPMLRPHPGRYRLVAAPRSTWYIESATYGGSEVLGQTLTVNPGSGALPLQLIVNNDVGNLEGKVSGSGAATEAWIVLLPSFPCATPMISFRASNDGSYSRTLQPGSYLALALEHRTGEDLADPAVRGRLGLHTQTVVIEPSTRSTLDLEVQSAGSSML